MIITINGADGSGKSTIIDAITKHTNGEFTHYHSRPGNLLSKNNKTKQQQYIDRPGDVPKRPYFFQIAKVILFVTEFHFLAFYHKCFARKKLIVLERSMADMFAHPERYGLETNLVEGLQSHLFDWYAALNICLTGDPRIMANRKQELDVSEIARLNERYLQISSQKMERLLVIDTTNTTISDTATKLVERLRILIPNLIKSE